MLSSINAPVDDPNITVKISIKDIITDIVRLQGEELIRVRNELEKAHVCAHPVDVVVELILFSRASMQVLLKLYVPLNENCRMPHTSDACRY